MMNKLKAMLVIAALSLVATALLPCNAQAAQTPLSDVYFAAGSSAQFNTFALAAGLDNAYPGNSALCGEHHWTAKYKAGSTGAQLVDPRSGSILPEGGNIWIVWNDAAQAATSGGIVCSYIAVDSVVGNRAYFASATMNIVSPANSGSTLDLDAGIVPGLPLDTTDGLPQTIVNYLQGQAINVAQTDVRPEDAKFATIRALTGYGLRIPRYLHTGLGYSTGAPPTNPLGNPVYSAYSGAQANVVDYVIEPTDTDPFTMVTGARPYSVQNIGAAPVMVVYNYSDAAAGHFGDGNYTDIQHLVLAHALSGMYTHIRQLSPTAYVSLNGTINVTEPDAPLHVWQREPISGTFNTMEYDICLTRTIYPTYEGPGTYGQETGVNPSNTTCSTYPCSVASGNPFYYIAANNATRGRAVGTGDMINAVYATTDSMGYAFWGYSNFYGKNTKLKYMTVDGVDPLYLNPGNGVAANIGVIPQCTGTSGAPPCPALTFPNIANGTYPIWSVYRAVYDPTVSNLIVTAMINYAQHAVVNTTSGFSDFVPSTSLTVFRSHYNQVVVTSNSNDQVPNNGFFAPGTGPIESGGDVGGAVLTIQSELDYINDTAGLNGCPAAPLGCQQTNMFQ
jgi:hypothetical protein